MKNLNEPLKPERTAAEVIPFESRAKELESAQCVLPNNQIDDLQARWDAIQASFVDEPSGAVKEADALVDSAIHEISETFKQQRQQLGDLWSRGDDVSTEELRLALQRYRSFFSRLISI